MPLRPDPTSWFQLPDTVAAYQAIGAPDAFQARRNMRHGGADRYFASSLVIPAWSPITGWDMNGTNWLSTGITGHSWFWTLIARWANWTDNTGTTMVGSYTGSTAQFRIQSYGVKLFFNGNSNNAFTISSGVAGMAGLTVYANGTAVRTIPSTSLFTAAIGTIGLGARDSGLEKATGKLQCAAVYRRTLTPSEMAAAMQQMAFCEKNPDWSVWARRRRWYYGAAVAAGAVGIYGKRGAVALPGGVRIEAVQ